MHEFLALRAPAQRLAREFWRDYLHCADVTHMPVHARMAAARLRKYGPLTGGAATAAATATRLIQKADPTKNYTQDEIWHAERAGRAVAIVSTACGVAFAVPAEAQVELAPVRGGTCIALDKLGPLKGKAGDVFAMIMIMVHIPKPGESLAQYAALVDRGAGAVATSPEPRCPAQACLAYRAVKAQLYAAEGGGEGLYTFFAGKAPRYPGLRFERPASPATPGATASSPRTASPAPELGRLAPTLYYVVMLDTGVSVRVQAEQAYTAFLAGIRLDAAGRGAGGSATPGRGGQQTFGRVRSAAAPGIEEKAGKTGAP
jgi:hypothetical protein